MNKRYFEIEFGILADGAQYNGDYETPFPIVVIVADFYPNFSDAEKLLGDYMVKIGCDCVHSITEVTEEEFLSGYDNIPIMYNIGQ